MTDLDKNKHGSTERKKEEEKNKKCVEITRYTQSKLYKHIFIQ